MPFYDVRVSRKLEEKTKMEMVLLLGEAIELIPDKNRNGVQVQIQDGCFLKMGRKTDDTAFLDLKIYGTYSQAVYDRLTERIWKIFLSELEIRKENIYITYTEIPFWGVIVPGKMPAFKTLSE